MASSARIDLSRVGQSGLVGDGLVSERARRGNDLRRAAAHNPTAAARCHADIAVALASLTTATKRIGHNRKRGDGGEAGRRLIGEPDTLVAPLRQRFDLPPARQREAVHMTVSK